MAHRNLVTGGAGFIGSHLVDHLLARGETVVVLDNLSSGRGENLAPCAKLVVGDIRDAELLRDLIRNVDSVFHLAALVSVQECVNKWDVGHAINLGGTIKLFQAAAEKKMFRSFMPPRPRFMVTNPDPIVARQAIPLLFLLWRGQAELRAPSPGNGRNPRPVFGRLAFFNVYGPRQDPASPYAGVISKFCGNRLANRPHMIYGDGLQSRDFIYVSDIVEGLILARAHAQGIAGAKAFNLCTGVGTNLVDLVDQIDTVAGRGASPVAYADARGGYPHVRRKWYARSYGTGFHRTHTHMRRPWVALAFAYDKGSERKFASPSLEVPAQDLLESDSKLAE